jgi:hypothetical protein
MRLGDGCAGGSSGDRPQAPAGDLCEGLGNSAYDRVSRNRVRKEIRLPRGRKRPGWEREFASRLAAASWDLSGHGVAGHGGDPRVKDWEESIARDYCWFVPKIGLMHLVAL